jgi:hypothetical protein
MDNDSTGQESNNGVSSDNDGSSVKGDAKMGGESHSMRVEGNVTYHDFSSSDESSGTDTSSGMGNDSSKYSLGVDSGTDSQSKSSDSRYSLGVDTSSSGDSRSQADRTETESSSRSERWTSRFSLGIETDSTTSSRYSLGLDKNLGLGSESTSSRFSLGIFEPTSPSFSLRTGEQLPGDTTPKRPNDSKEAPRNKPENQASTSGTTEIKDQQKSSSQASGNSTNVRDWLSKEFSSVKEWLHELFDSQKPERIGIDKAVNVTPVPEKMLFTNTPDSGDKIKSIAVEAAKNNFNNCSGSVREVANKRGIALGGAQANDQVQYMEENWREVSMEDAKKLADNGKLVVAGLAEPRNGHVAVVVKGNGVQREGKTWPNVAGGSLGTKEAKEKPGKAYSEGGNTIRDAWGAKKRDKVKFYTPE